MSEFRVGDEVVCVDSSIRDFSDDENNYIGGIEVVEGQAYVVRWVGWEGAPCICVDGIYRPDDLSPDRPFYSDRFRPVVRKSDSIAIFRQMCVDAPKLAKKVRTE